mmetsp:Transcript_22672/g.45603  ORF Transcript_22672/g.45603 Transcript_22672/m.45603 type:complete len:259 (+) Transcript_22672:1059-1835(+)
MTLSAPFVKQISWPSSSQTTLIRFRSDENGTWLRTLSVRTPSGPSIWSSTAEPPSFAVIRWPRKDMPTLFAASRKATSSGELLVYTSSPLSNVSTCALWHEAKHRKKRRVSSQSLLLLSARIFRAVTTPSACSQHESSENGVLERGRNSPRSCPSMQHLAKRISFWVMVPVLSENTCITCPSSSTRSAVLACACSPVSGSTICGSKLICAPSTSFTISKNTYKLIGTIWYKMIQYWQKLTANSPKSPSSPTACAIAAA